MKRRVLLILTIIMSILFSFTAGHFFSCENTEIYDEHLRLFLTEKFSTEDLSIECILEPFVHFLVRQKNADAKQESYIFLLSKEMGLSQEGYNGLIHLGILLDPEHAINEIIVIDHDETQGFMDYIMESGFIEEIKNSPDIKEVDAVSGATLSSQAIKKAVLRSLHRYRTEVLKQ